MKVRVVIAETPEEIVVEGECLRFGGHTDYTQNYDRTLDNIGFWLHNWRRAGHSGPTSKGKMFIPWTSALYIIELV